MWRLGMGRALPKKLPASGSEPLFSDLYYGTPEGIDSYNCYAYALGSRRGRPGYKMQPGDLAHEPSDRDADSCPTLTQRALHDNRRRGIRTVAPAARCPKGSYKIMSFIDPGKDYHWYRQAGHALYRMRPGDTLASVAKELRVPRSAVVPPTPAPRPGDLVFVRNANVFSHKQGLATGPLLRDRSGKVIPDPRRANRDYGDLNYTRFCSAMCVRASGAKPTAGEAKNLRSLLRRRARMLA